jgi:four helix bundle protein
MSYKDLEIFKESKRLALQVHAMSLKLPKFELYEEGSQVRRPSKAIASMIVEGYGRKRYKAEFIRYLVIGHAECDETMLHLAFLQESGSAGDLGKMRAEYEILSKKIYTYINWVEENFRPTQ